MEWIDLILFILYSFLLWLCEKNNDRISRAIIYYSCSIVFLFCFVIIFTYKQSFQSIFMFYLCLIIVISTYIYQTFKATKIFKNFFDKTGKKRYIIILEISIVLLSLLF